MVPVAVFLSLQNNRAGESSTDLQRVDQQNQTNQRICLENRRVAVKHWISFVCRTSCPICPYPASFGDNVSSLQQDLRTLRTACLCIHSLRIRVEARANTAERAVIDQQIQFVRTTVQPYPTEDLRTADTSCLSRTSFTSANSSW